MNVEIGKASPALYRDSHLLFPLTRKDTESSQVTAQKSLSGWPLIVGAFSLTQRRSNRNTMQCSGSCPCRAMSTCWSTESIPEPTGGHPGNKLALKCRPGTRSKSVLEAGRVLCDSGGPRWDPQPFPLFLSCDAEGEDLGDPVL